jgi:predicted enzyme related to lactoylglutathione lyase
MPHPIVHAEIRSSDPDATREFCANLFGWSYSDGAYPGYTYVGDTAPGQASGNNLDLNGGFWHEVTASV